MTTADLLPFVYSLAIGLLVGFERERSHRGGPRQAAGSRTFALLALFGTLAASFGAWAVIAGLVAVAALLAVGYRRTSDEDPGTTTEVAALMTYLLGALAFTQAPLAAALAIIATVLLTAKGRIHAFARDVVTDTEVEDALKFMVIAFVILPLLPDHDLGPYGVLNPAHLWLLVVALTGISWAGYIAVRALGAQRGLLVTGLAGGFVSATATTGSMGRLFRSTHALRATVAGAQVASIATFIQLVAILAVVNSEVVSHLWPSLLAGGAVLATIAWLGYRGGEPSADAGANPEDALEPTVPTGAQTAAEAGAQSEAQMAADKPGGRPFAFVPALVLAGVLTLALLVGRWGAATFGPKGAVFAAGAAGLADAHAGALSATTLFQQGDLGLAATLLAIGAALAANSVVKCVVAFSSGGRRFGLRFAAGLVPSIAVVLIGLALTASAV
ncbi:MAG TPA: DUF4010 domain-containing protein [Acidimicrobiales bacterium]